MRTGIPALSFAIALALAAAAPVLAKSDKSEDHNKGPKSERIHDEHRGGPDTHISVGILIGDDDRRIIRDYYDAHPFRPEPLPPGIAKNLARGKPLPPGIAKRHMAPDLIRRLPSREGCDWLIVGVNAVLVDRHSGIVLDIAADIFL